MVPSAMTTVHAVYLPRPRIEISGPQGVQATFDWQAARDSVVGRMCTASLLHLQTLPHASRRRRIASAPRSTTRCSASVKIASTRRAANIRSILARPLASNIR